MRLLAVVVVAGCGRIDFDALPNCIADLSADGNTACVARSDGLLACWGGNGVGTIGDGTTIDRAEPTRVPLAGVVGVGAGEHNTCAVTASGSAYCWGFNDLGESGDGTTTERNSPVPVMGLTDAVEIATGQYHSCARLRDGSIACWGDGQTGALGDGTRASRLTPVPTLPLPSPAISLALGDHEGCVRMTDASVACWGDANAVPNGVELDMPTVIPALAGATQIAAGCHLHSCAVLADGSVDCWGVNQHGELGDGTLIAHADPRPVFGLGPARAVAVGAGHTCAIRTDGTVACWGQDPADGTVATTPVTVPGLVAIEQITAGCFFSCARRGGDIWCWGENSNGDLGDGTFTSTATPVRAIGACSL